MASEMLPRYICIHGHFYQPSRANPWLERVGRQESAKPYHDWNERIASECYGPNAAARILDHEGRVARSVNNYSHISFDFGPTLLGWIEQHIPETYKAILDADRISLKRFHGHGSALAQSYSHSILPLLNQRDKATEVRWGIADFRMRFNRNPEGMWLPETAVNTETLEILAEQGILFTILAPHQARRYRQGGTSIWQDAHEHTIDTSLPYRVRLPSGRTIAIFFFNPSLWRAVTSEGLLHNGDNFASRLLELAPPSMMPRLVHVATDGEIYGHHHRFGEMALAYTLEVLSQRHDVALTNYGDFLECCPPEKDVEVVENSSWSCPHGIQRWTAECGCRAGICPTNSQQAWRAPLWEGLDCLRAELLKIFIDQSAGVFKDPFQARDLYIEIFNGVRSITDLVDARTGGQPANETHVRALKLLESQRHAALMLTSCGWFFDDVSRVEPVQNLSHAARAIQLLREWATTDLEAELVTKLAAAPSNFSEIGDGRRLWEREIRPRILDLDNVVARHAVRSLWAPPSECNEDAVDGFSVKVRRHCTFELDNTRMAVGCVCVVCRRTRESREFCFGVVRHHDGSLSGGVGACIGDENFSTLLESIRRAVSQNQMAELLCIFQDSFGSMAHSIRYLPGRHAWDREFWD